MSEQKIGRRSSSHAVDPNALHVTSVLERDHELAIIAEDATLDEKVLLALGYKQEFKRYELQWHQNLISY